MKPILVVACVFMMASSVSVHADPIGDVTEEIERLTQQCDGIAHISYRVNITIAVPPGQADSGLNSFDYDRDEGWFFLLRVLPDGNRVYSMSGVFDHGKCIISKNQPPPEPKIYCLLIPRCPGAPQ